MVKYFGNGQKVDLEESNYCFQCQEFTLNKHVINDLVKIYTNHIKCLLKLYLLHALILNCRYYIFLYNIICGCIVTLLRIHTYSAQIMILFSKVIFPKPKQKHNLNITVTVSQRYLHVTMFTTCLKQCVLWTFYFLYDATFNMAMCGNCLLALLLSISWSMKMYVSSVLRSACTVVWNSVQLFQIDKCLSSTF